MPANEVCPQPEVFEQFLTGGLSDEQLLMLESHLETCDSCGDTVRAMNVNDTLIEMVQDSKLPVIDLDEATSSIAVSSREACRLEDGNMLLFERCRRRPASSRSRSTSFARSTGNG